ncbi:hypothetical protein SAMN05421768_106310 [Chryseobacterium joostei]|uniref:Uncharacterized protein n=1 Tax=Chryseobacterium joostei TaxID=112234 RepID=A0A1N7IRQ8_9FLAO|nr:hypothetical protein SAMN05421768_106310 [Chryseobacterium joostei]
MDSHFKNKKKSSNSYAKLEAKLFVDYFTKTTASNCLK